MRSFFGGLVATAALFQSAMADLTGSNMVNKTAVAHNFKAAAINCANRVPQLNQADCEYMSKIGFVDQGHNSLQPNGRAWIGNNGAYTFKFTNRASNPGPVPVTLVLWLWENDKDYQAMCVNVRRPYITVSLPNVGDSVVISIAPGNTGAFAALNNHATYINGYGQISNTWGEFNTGQYATFDVSREVDMNGNIIRMTGSNGCVSNFQKCTFVCTNGQRTCGEAGTYALNNCGAPNPGAHTDPGPNGGSGGWNNGGRGHVDVELARY